MFKKIICLFALLTTISMLLVANVSKKETKNTIKNELKVKRKQVVNDDGSITITITYQVLPEEANDKSVTLSLSWSDSSVNDDVNDYLLLEHDASNFEVAITMLKRATTQAKLTITSNSNPGVSAVILIDFEQEVEEPEELTDLTNTVWNIPAGWTAAAGYGEFSIETEVNQNTYNYLTIGSYLGTNDGMDWFQIPSEDVIEFNQYERFISSQSFTITITGGSDATNTTLISWLQENGTLQ